MGQISILTPEQKIVLDGIKLNNFIKNNFYFTGGTALSEYYLQHRYSEDIDFFTENKFDPQIIIAIFDSLKKKLGFEYKMESIETVNMFYLYFDDKPPLKIDFNWYSGKRLKQSIFKDGIFIDSSLDIAVNKLLTIVQRTDIKDFVDFYYLEPMFGFWDLREGAKVKFNQDLEVYNISSDFLKIEDFDVLPRMIKPLTLDELKAFFRGKAKELGQTMVEE